MTQNVSQEVGCMGSRVKESWIVFRSEGDQGIYVSAPLTADAVTKTLGMKETNQIQAIGGSVANAALLWTHGGGKSMSYLPKIENVYTEVGG